MLAFNWLVCMDKRESTLRFGLEALLWVPSILWAQALKRTKSMPLLTLPIFDN